ncbi:Hypothetical predicted protein [Mytilus galloprovincialis]|uniref:Mammalian ependymin-related protein 1 n=1 Tax=Mytilus galloprovincialis TaxID=29158 RepID=A0A8B6GNX6_MYTGA|nr:Hypothetical predicted protein [Mytilus galloprovincialis]
MKIIITLCCLVAVQSQVPTPCESPKQWEGEILRVDRSNHAELHLLDQRIKVSYDEVNQRLREIDRFSFTSDNPMFEVIYLHKLNKKYIVNLKTRQCNVSTVTMPFRPLGVPVGATFTGYSTLGASGLQGQFLNVASWYSTEGPNRYYGSVSTPDCFPVEYNYYSPPVGFVTSTISMELTSQEEKENQAATGLRKAIISVATFKFTLEEWEVVEADIRAA